MGRLNLPFSPQPKTKSAQAASIHNRKARLFRDAVWAHHRVGGPKGQEYAVCAVCKTFVYRGVDGNVDHIKMRSTHPELRYEPSNGRPVHQTCNARLKADKALRESLA